MYQTSEAISNTSKSFSIRNKWHFFIDPQQWHKWLPYVLLAYRTRIHSSSGFTPFQLMFGREMNMFEDYKTLTDSPLEIRSKEIKE
jgi:hypothetical protein